MRFYILLTCATFVLATPLLAGEDYPKITPDNPVFDYQWDQSPGKPIKVRPGEITYLSMDGAEADKGVKVDHQKRMGIWGMGDGKSVRWVIQAEKPHRFEVRVMATVGRYGAKPKTITIKGPKNTVVCQCKKRGVAEGALEIPAGKSTIEVTSGRVFALELVDVKDIADLDKRVEKFRSKATWMSDRTYGIMFQWGQWGWPEHGQKKKWPEMINDFDVERWANMMEEMGAGWVVWSVTWSTQYMPAPIKSRREICPGFNCDRDLLGEIADALHKRDIKLMFYYHPGHSTGEFWKVYALGEDGKIDRNKWFRNFVRVVGEMGERYGKKLNGWGFDDGRHYYPAPFEELGWAAKTGNPDRYVEYNPWRLARLTDFAELTQAEHGAPAKPSWPVNEHGIYQEGPYKGLIAGGCFLPERSGWGVKEKNWKIKDPKMSPQQWVEKLNTARKNHTTLTPCICMWESGKINPKTYELFVHARRKFRGVSDEELIQKRKKRGDEPTADSYIWKN